MTRYKLAFLLSVSLCWSNVVIAQQESDSSSRSVLQMTEPGQIPFELELSGPEPAVDADSQEFTPTQELPLGPPVLNPPVVLDSPTESSTEEQSNLNFEVIEPLIPELISPLEPLVQRELQSTEQTDHEPQNWTPTIGVIGKPINGWGFAVLEVVPNSAAARMKLEPGDVILAVNGKAACSVDSIANQLLNSSVKHNGLGFVLIDNVRGRTPARSRSPKVSCGRSDRKELRFQKIWFQL